MNRSREQQLKDILEYLAIGDRNQTAISEKCVINPAPTARYLDLLKRNGHVSISPDRKISITSKGRELLKAIEHVERQLR